MRLEDLTDSELMQLIYEIYETMDGRLKKRNCKMN